MLDLQPRPTDAEPFKDGIPALLTAIVYPQPKTEWGIRSLNLRNNRIQVADAVHLRCITSVSRCATSSPLDDLVLAVHAISHRY